MTTPPVQLQCMEVWGGNHAVSNGVTMPGLDAWVYARPHHGDASGGDVHYLSSCATGRITRLMIADVSGHGQAASATATSLRGLMRRFINHLDQTRAVEGLNTAFAQSEHSGRFATAILGTFWGPTNELTLCNAGHPRPLWYRAKDRQWRYLDSSPTSPTSSSTRTEPVDDEPFDVPLGVLDSTRYRQLGLRLGRGDLVLLYTDSLVEARLPGPPGSTNLLGETGLLQAAREAPAEDPTRFIDALLATIAERGATLDDDVTALLLRPNGLTPPLTLGERLAALGRIVRGVFSPRDRTALPEVGMRTAGGLVADRFNR